MNFARGSASDVRKMGQSGDLLRLISCHEGAGYIESQRQGQEVIWLDTHLRRHMHANERARIITPAWERPVADTNADHSVIFAFQTNPSCTGELGCPSVKLVAREGETCC